ncbi:MAG: type II toxin-antitoxin system VapC family toxin [Nitrososphaerota archaeon]|nr:type II toxin-antitoxin system VapC family toxin [Nitrososphaerota archaeon]MDG7018521.1 type II toxin-antitoxin system VapC family toxin [Nitrososphaerota archaeon]MDG7019982.1 type II toxin-antitoxin system VapC family toxin [Nitrososphaerota archaeon]MDG7028503.1 type II toxin-antitoxin system VapC family toxin [Nitrososphaerota archaeon]
MDLVFDTQALLVLYLDEAGAEKVAASLKKVLDRSLRGYINVVNLAELYYILARRSKREAEEKEQNLRSYGVRVLPVTDRERYWKDAATIKARKALSLADAFAASTAVGLKATLVTGGDADFDGIEGLTVERVC